MKIGIFGGGAIGQAIASFIYKDYKESVYFTALDKYFERLKNGINVNGNHYDVKVTKDLKMDYLFICVKNYDLEKIEKVLKEYNMDLSVRAEQISSDIFIAIANSLEE